MKTLIAGSSGMVGSAVTRHLIECGHEVVRLVRHTPGPGEVWWNPDGGEIDTAGLEGLRGCRPSSHHALAYALDG
jgi:nucleoside-diphosphate-sugar epimerase